MKDTNGKPVKEKFIACSSGKKKYEIVNPLDEKVKIRGKKMEIQVIEEHDGFTYLVWKRKRYQVDILEKNQNKYTVMINGVWYSFTIETPISYKRRRFLSRIIFSSNIEKIIAPMPGKILNVLVEENANIQQGEAVVILEAMKMQNEILSHVAGRVKKINVRQNDSVMKDDIMFEIDKKI
jgi:biotin carboxyl carrier protein